MLIVKNCSYSFLKMGDIVNNDGATKKEYRKSNSRVERLELKITSTSTLININL